ncbi:MAG TPA: hypothetical protein VN909_08600 [Candidatus Dormibacteraeota bacterium]|nr:hypothetical protein [Candidatus Dormibacteraeota bacterium]
MKHPVLLGLGSAAFVLALVAAPVVSSAQPAPAPTMVPMTKPDFSSMMFLTGTWSCTQMLRGKQRPDTSTTSIDKSGMWMVTQDVAPPFDQYRTFAVNSMNWTTYDPTVKQWVTIGTDDTGGYFLASTPGWQGNAMTSTSKGLDGSSVSDVLTKVSDTKTSDVQTATDAQGKVTTASITCTKSS